MEHGHVKFGATSRQCVLAGLLVFCLSLTAGATEFNIDGNREGWNVGARIHSLEVKDGALVATVLADTNDPYVNGPYGPYDADRATGVQMRMRWSFLDEGIEAIPEDFQAGPRIYYFPVNPIEGLAGHGEKGYESKLSEWWPFEPGEWSIIYVDLWDGTSQQPWQGMIGNYRYDLADNVFMDYQVEVDWIRLVDYWVQNNNFERFWFNDFEPWEQIGAGTEDSFEVTESDSFSEWSSLQITGLGTADSDYHALEQEIYNGTELEKGSRVSVVGAYKIPADSWDADSTLWFRVRESDGTNEYLSDPVEATAFDEWVQFSSTLALALEPAERTSLSVQLYSKNPAGAEFYVDDIFVDVQTPEAIVSLETFPNADWEFNVDGDDQGWSTGNQVENIEAAGGSLTFTYPAGSNDPYLNGPAGPYPGPRYGGAAIRMRINTGLDLVGPEMFWFPTEGGHASSTFSIPAVNEWFTAFIDVDEQDWGGEVNNIRFDFPNFVEEDAFVEIDWIRFLDEHIVNNSFESGIEPWTIRNNEGVISDFIVQSDVVYSGQNALMINGVGGYHAVWQQLEGYNTSIPKNAQVTVKGMYYVPEGTELTDLWVRINEKASGEEHLSEHVAVEQYDAWTPFEYTLTLISEPQDRDWISLELFSNVAVGQPIYLDDIFITIYKEPVNYGWPVNAVRLDADQTITIDGQVTAEEYDGAQAVVINSETLRGIEDPYFEGLTHGGINSPDAQQETPLDDFNGTYYFMWDDENFYAGLSAADDINSWVGPDPNGADALQFIFADSPDNLDSSTMFIPTLAIDDGDSNVVYKNAFSGWLPQDLSNDVEYAGKVEADGDYAIEIRIPWTAMQGAITPEVFPPSVDDMIGFCILAIDYDDGALQWFASNHTFFPWNGAGVERLYFVERDTAVADWSIY